MSPADPGSKYATKAALAWGFTLVLGVTSLLLWFTATAVTAATEAKARVNSLEVQNAVIVERLSAVQTTLNEVRADVKRLAK